jgi:hypothetical protein
MIRQSSKVIAATTTTEALLRDWARDEDQYKIERVGLPFQIASLQGGKAPASVFELAARVDKIIACVTRVHPSKGLDRLFRSVERFLMVNKDCGFVIAGFDESNESRRIRSVISASSVADRCVTLPLLKAREIGGLFRVARCSIWSQVSIGIYHSLFCGCPALVRKGQDALHLLRNPEAGAWFNDLDSIDAVLPSVIDSVYPRSVVSSLVDQYEAEHMITRIVADALKLKALEKLCNSD